MKNPICLLVALFLFLLPTTAQDYTKSKFITLRGRIESISGEPLTFATIRVKNTRLGTYSNIKGEFELNVPLLCKLEVSSVGFLDEEVSCNNNSYLTIVLRKKVRTDSITIISSSLSEINPRLEKLRYHDYKSEEQIFTRIEVSAQFPGGSSKFREYLKNNIFYPDTSLLTGVEGVVVVKFTVGANGYLKNIVIIKGLDKYCDSLVVQAFRSMPAWFPAIQNGRKVDEELEYNVRFTRTAKVN